MKEVGINTHLLIFIYRSKITTSAEGHKSISRSPSFYNLYDLTTGHLATSLISLIESILSFRLPDFRFPLGMDFINNSTSIVSDGRKGYHKSLISTSLSLRCNDGALSHGRSREGHKHAAQASNNASNKAETTPNADKYPMSKREIFPIGGIDRSSFAM
ncbi:hypothetical protein DM860_002064 [Cuscuta australis]|uniref:Uncharacterized protein n=1 Tax=Cuscuta australis TaxID=267555 RepID=A0A328E036_9ASTE|nr:hypothetical protein DM860_002064 [Cuscuta australis]